MVDIQSKCNQKDMDLITQYVLTLKSLPTAHTRTSSLASPSQTTISQSSDINFTGLLGSPLFECFQPCQRYNSKNSNKPNLACACTENNETPHCGSTFEAPARNIVELSRPTDGMFTVNFSNMWGTLYIILS